MSEPPTHAEVMVNRLEEYVCRYFRIYGYWPTVREVADGLGLRSSSTAHKWIKVACETERLAYEGLPRTLRLVA
jgi:SOS-response transcriptional repressor LexA